MKAVIPAAGWGTRFLPAAKTLPKEMLPIGAKPAIQVIVEEALAAGAEEVVIISSPEKPSIRAHFTADEIWRARAAHKQQIARELEALEALGRKIKWVEQTEQKGLGHAVLQARELLADEKEPILVLLGDALVSGTLPSAAMVAVSREFGGASVVGLEEVALERVSRYGIADARMIASAAGGEGRVFKLHGLVEKPTPEAAPSRLAIAGRYLLSPAIFKFLASQAPGTGGEIQLTDAIAQMLLAQPVYGYRYPGTRHDIGNPAGYLKALQALSR